MVFGSVVCGKGSFLCLFSAGLFLINSPLLLEPRASGTTAEGTIKFSCVNLNEYKLNKIDFILSDARVTFWVFNEACAYNCVELQGLFLAKSPTV